MTELEALARECIENHTHKLIARPTKQDIYTRYKWEGERDDCI